MGADDKQKTLARLFQGRFEIREKLPWNGLALVYGAKGLMHRDLAVAVLPLDCDSNPAHSRLFHRTFERLKAQQALPAPAVQDLGIQRGVPFVAWEREEGVLLAEMLDGAMPVAGAVEMTDQLLAALEPVHAMGLHHGDLTPSNVLVQPSGVRLLGLGIAPLLRRMGPDATGPTGRGSGPNARRYLAPEILQNRLVGDDAPGPASDIYAVGALLHRLLTGLPPGEELDEDARERLEANPELATIIQRAMSESPSDRPSIEALRAMLADDGENPKTLPPEAASEAAAAPAPVAVPKPAAVPKPIEVPKPVEASKPIEVPKPAAVPKDAAVVSEPAAQPAPVAEGGGGAGKWVAVLVLLAAAGVGAWLVLGRGEDPAATVAESESEAESASESESEAEAEAESEPEPEAEGEPALGSLGASGPLVGVSDPFLVEELQRIGERGASYEQEDFRRIYGWISRNPGDVRGHLVLARAYAERGWHRAVVESYEEALGVDAEGAKSDPLILGHLIDAYVNGSEPVVAMAWPLLRRHWGRNAAAALEPLEAQALRPALRQRVRSLRNRIERLPPD